MLISVDGVSEDRIRRSVDWYSEHVGEPYVPDIQSGQTFREKFLKLENAMNRGGSGGAAIAETESLHHDDRPPEKRVGTPEWCAAERAKIAQDERAKRENLL